MNNDQIRDALADALDRERHTGPLIPLLAEVADALIAAAADSRSLTQLHFQAGNVANGYHQQNRSPKILNLANRVITAGQLLAAQHAAIAARHDDDPGVSPTIPRRQTCALVVGEEEPGSCGRIATKTVVRPAGDKTQAYAWRPDAETDYDFESANEIAVCDIHAASMQRRGWDIKPILNLAARHDDPDEAYRDALDERDADRLADWNS